MATVYSILDGCIFGCGLSVLPALVQDVATGSSTSSVLFTLSLAVFTFHFGKAVSSYFNTCSLGGSTLISVLFSSICLLFFSVSSNVVWILVMRFALGLVSGYLGFFFEISRSHVFSRISWILAVGFGAFVSGFFYVNDRNSTQPFHSSPRFFQDHPVFLSALCLALILVASFVGYVFMETLGFDEADDCTDGKSAYAQIIQFSIDDQDEEVMKGPLRSSHGSHSATVSSCMNPCHTHTEEGTGDYDNRELLVPSRYIRGCGEHQEALRRWRATLAWRQENDVDSILDEPQPNFWMIKQCYPHFLHGRSKLGHPVYYEQLGRIDIEKLREHGISVAALLRHYIFITEYIWTHVEPDDNFGQTVSILDVSGVGIGDLMGEALDFLKESTKMIQSHYVERCNKIFVVNASYLFSMLWRMVQPMIHENTRRKISILSASELSQIQEVVDRNQLPDIYGGTGGALGSGEEELALHKFVRILNQRAGVHMAEDASPLNDDNSPDCDTPSASASGIAGDVIVTESLPVHRRPLRGTGQDGYNSIMDWQEDGEVGLSDDEEENGIPMEHAAPGHHMFQSPIISVSNWVASMGQSALNTTLSAATSVFSSSRSTDSKIGESTQPKAHLGRKNDFVYNSALRKWELKRSGGDDMGVTQFSPLGAREVEYAEEDDDTCSVDSNEEQVIRAIQAAHGYVSESEDEGDDVNVSRRGRKLFRVNISTKKLRVLQTLSLWSYMHWAWRAALTCSLEALPVYVLISRSHKGLGLPPILMGCVVLAASCAIAMAQRIHYRYNRFPSKGFFKRSLACVLAIEIITLVLVISLAGALTPIVWSSQPSGNEVTVLSLFISFALTALLFSLGVTNIFTSAVMSSYKTHLYSPAARSRACFADALGGMLGIMMMLTSDYMGVPSILALLAPFIVTLVVHTFIAIVNYANPSAAGNGMDLGNVMW